MEEGLEALDYAAQQDAEDKLFARWLSSSFSFQSEFSFNDFKEQIGAQTKWRVQTSKEIVSDLDTLMEGREAPLGNI